VKNQLTAFRSWLPLASAVVYFGKPEPLLASEKTRFIPSEPFPRICEIVDFCADQPEWSMILNADIYVHPVFVRLEKRLIERKAGAASSWRHEFDPAVGVDPCERVDNGLDFFAAVPGVWSVVYDHMGRTPQGDHDSPRHLRLGGPSWDAWMVGALNKVTGHHFYNLTKYKVIRHPRHGSRRYCADIPDVHHIGACSMPERDLG